MCTESGFQCIRVVNPAIQRARERVSGWQMEQQQIASTKRATEHVLFAACHPACSDGCQQVAPQQLPRHANIGHPRRCTALTICIPNAPIPNAVRSTAASHRAHPVPPTPKVKCAPSPGSNTSELSTQQSSERERELADRKWSRSRLLPPSEPPSTSSLRLASPLARIAPNR